MAPAIQAGLLASLVTSVAAERLLGARPCGDSGDDILTTVAGDGVLRLRQDSQVRSISLQDMCQTGCPHKHAYRATPAASIVRYFEQLCF